MSASTPSSNQYFFSYSIRISYSPGEAYPNLPPSVQLHSRRWLIRQDEELVDEVRGEGVIGKVSSWLEDSDRQEQRAGCKQLKQIFDRTGVCVLIRNLRPSLLHSNHIEMAKGQPTELVR